MKAKTLSLFNPLGKPFIKPCWLLIFLLLGSTLAQEVTVRCESFVVTVDTSEERVAPTSQACSGPIMARPGQMIEYRLHLVNQSSNTLPPGTVLLRNSSTLMPESTPYVANSATASTERVLTEFSVDGQTFAEHPLRQGNQELEQERYRMIRWTVMAPLAPGETITVVYRVRVRET